MRPVATPATVALAEVRKSLMKAGDELLGVRALRKTLRPWLNCAVGSASGAEAANSEPPGYTGSWFSQVPCASAGWYGSSTERASMAGK